MKPSSPGASSSDSFSTATPRTREAEWIIERIAQRTAKLVLDELDEREHEQAQRPGRLTTTHEVAEHLGVDDEWVTTHGYELGGVRLGDGPKPPWRFPPLHEVDELLRGASVCSADRGSESGEPRSAAAVAPKSRGRVSGTRTSLLPIRGEETDS